MPVYRSHRLVHLHIPKTAGTAIEEMMARLGDMSWDEQSWYGIAHRGGRNWEYQHLTALELRSLSAGSFEGFSTFAVVRDPFDRLVSDFRWRQAVVNAGAEHVISYEHFDDYLAAIPADLDWNWSRYIALADRAQANHLIHVRPQWHYLCNAQHRRDHRIEVVRFEHLHDELESLFHRFGIRAALHQRRSPMPRYHDHFTSESIERVAAIYRTDLEWFGYEPPHPDPAATTASTPRPTSDCTTSP